MSKWRDYPLVDFPLVAGLLMLAATFTAMGFALF
jgi:hypothetical protein